MSDALDWPFFEPRHRAFATELDAWAATALGHAHGHDRADVDATCRSLVRSLGEAGWLAHAVAGRVHGGAGDAIDTRSICLARETLARHDGLADFAFAMQGLGSGAISLAGTAEQKAHYLPRVAQRQVDRRVRALRARRRLRRRRDGVRGAPDGDGYVLDGEKTWISNGGIADFYVVFARTGDANDPAAKGARGISAFIVDADAPGFSIAERIDVIAPHPLARLRFNGCRIPATQPHRRRRRGLQGRDANARRLPHLGRRRRARLRAPRLRRGDGARDLAQDVRRRPRRLPAHAGQARADGARRSTAPRSSPTAPPGCATGRATSRARRRWPSSPPPKARSR